MAYEKILYDATALEMFKRLEYLWCNSPKTRNAEQQIDEFIKRFRNTLEIPKKIPDIMTRISETRGNMHKIRKMRNKIAHSADGVFRIHPVSFLSFSEFKEFQDLCLELDKIFPEMKIRDIMIPTLKYDMGNAVDIIKHGMLAEFVAWWQEVKRTPLRFADPFAGCPWGNLPRDSVVYNRLDNLKDAVLRDIYFPKKGKTDKYFGSSHLVREVAQHRNLDTFIHVSDNDENARRNLWVSIRAHESMCFIKDLPDNNGYSVLSREICEQRKYNLILIDPYSDFLQDAPEEVRPQKLKDTFRHILGLVEANKNLVVAFVLFGEFEKDILSGHAVSLHCPKIEKKEGNYVKGESGHDAEILLIGEETADSKLRGRLRSFAETATKVLPLNGEKVEFWPEK